MAEGPKTELESDLARVRLVLMRELETISVYEALAREAEGPEARAFFEHLAREEKEHVAEATWLLRKLDPDQNVQFEKPLSAEHFSHVAAASGEVRQYSEVAQPTFTVGPLKRRP